MVQADNLCRDLEDSFGNISGITSLSHRLCATINHFISRFLTSCVLSDVWSIEDILDVDVDFDHSWYTLIIFMHDNQSGIISLSRRQCATAPFHIPLPYVVFRVTFVVWS